MHSFATLCWFTASLAPHIWATGTRPLSGSDCKTFRPTKENRSTCPDFKPVKTSQRITILLSLRNEFSGLQKDSDRSLHYSVILYVAYMNVVRHLTDSVKGIQCLVEAYYRIAICNVTMDFSESTRLHWCLSPDSNRQLHKFQLLLATFVTSCDCQDKTTERCLNHLWADVPTCRDDEAYRRESAGTPWFQRSWEFRRPRVS